MQPQNPQLEQPNNLARQQQSAIRVIGAFIGRALTTISVGLATRLYRQSQKPAADEEEEPKGAKRLLHEFKEEAMVSAATVLTWNMHLGGETGANVTEYIADKLGHLANQNYAVLPQYATPRTTLVADRAADSLLWRFANYAASSLPDTKFGLPTAVQQEMPRFF